VHLIARSQAAIFPRAGTPQSSRSAYSLVMLTQDELYAVRDPRVSVRSFSES